MKTLTLAALALGALAVEAQAADYTILAPANPGGGWDQTARVMQEVMQAEGISAELDTETYPNGRFAWLEDPEGNRIQLWEPNAAALARDPGPGSNASRHSPPGP